MILTSDSPEAGLVEVLDAETGVKLPRITWVDTDTGQAKQLVTCSNGRPILEANGGLMIRDYPGKVFVWYVEPNVEETCASQTEF